MLDLAKVKTFTKITLDNILKSEDKQIIQRKLSEYGLHIKDKKIIPMDEYKHLWEDTYKFWDKQQLVKKISSMATLSSNR